MENYDTQNTPDWQKSPQSAPPKNNQALAAMTLSIGGLISTFCCCLPAGLVMGILSIVLAVISKKKQPFCGYAIAALIIGILAVAANLAVLACKMLAYWLSESPVYGPMFNDMVRQYQQFYETMPTP